MNLIRQASEEAWQLYSDAELVGKLAKVASDKLERGDIAGAKEDLALCADHAGRVTFRFNEVQELIDRAEKEGA